MLVDRETLRSIYDTIIKEARAVVAPFTRGGKLDLSSPNSVGHLPPVRGGTGHDEGAEPPLGNPGTSGHVLSSTTAGVRSWVANGGGGGGGELLLDDGGAFLYDDDGDILYEG